MCSYVKTEEFFRMIMRKYSKKPPDISWAFEFAKKSMMFFDCDIKYSAENILYNIRDDEMRMCFLFINRTTRLTGFPGWEGSFKFRIFQSNNY